LQLKYAFASMAVFLSTGFESIIGILNLAPIKVSHATQLIADSVRTLTLSKKISTISNMVKGLYCMYKNVNVVIVYIVTVLDHLNY